MSEKKERILKVAIRLFSQRGYYATSIQEIADQSGISKGAFYLHFASKEELVLSILKSYYDMVQEKILVIDQKDISPREKLMLQISIYFKEIVERKELIMMQLQEQVLPMNPEVRDFMFRMRIEVHHWYEKVILDIYGERADVYRADAAILLDGLINAYIRILLISTETIDFSRLAAFLVRRLDDMIEGMIQREEHPLAADLVKVELFSPSFFSQEQVREEVKSILIAMRKQVDTLCLPSDKKEDAFATLECLLNEIKKEQPQKVIFQGLLANLREIEVLNEYRQYLAKRLNIKLL